MPKSVLQRIKGGAANILRQIMIAVFSQEGVAVLIKKSSDIFFPTRDKL
jgi:hypothetical protein